MTVSLQKKFADYTPDIASGYVPACQYAGDVLDSFAYSVAFGTPPAAATTGIVATQSIATAVTLVRSQFTTPASSFRAVARFGCILRVIASGAATSTIIAKGRDYLGQPLSETITLNGATAVNGVKAFKVLDSLTFGVTAATTASVGWGGIWGLPYKTVAVTREVEDGVGASAGTLTAAVLTDPATATTGDPRGRYTPTGTPDGAKDFTLFAIADNSVNASGNGGLHGIAHYYA